MLLETGTTQRLTEPLTFVVKSVARRLFNEGWCPAKPLLNAPTMSQRQDQDN